MSIEYNKDVTTFIFHSCVKFEDVDTVILGSIPSRTSRVVNLSRKVWIIWPTSASQITVERIGSIQIDKNFIT